MFLNFYNFERENDYWGGEGVCCCQLKNTPFWTLKSPWKIMFELVCSELIVQQTSVFLARYSERPNSTRYLLFYNENFIFSFLWVFLWQAEMLCLCVFNVIAINHHD